MLVYFTKFHWKHCGLHKTLTKARPTKDAAENSFVVKSSRLWNNLPEKLCLNLNINSFKAALKTIYFKCYKLAT
jgi:hypothetical protein